MKINSRNIIKNCIVLFLCLSLLSGLTGCNPDNKDVVISDAESVEKPETSDNTASVNDVADEVYETISENDTVSDDDIGDLDIADEIEEDIEPEIVDFNIDEAFKYCANPVCTYSAEKKQIEFGFSFDYGIPETDDDKVYLFEIATYEEDDIFDKEPIAYANKERDAVISSDYRKRYLFEKFIPAVLYDGEYIAISSGKYITNPEAMACNTEDYPDIGSKKGILLDGNTLGSEQFRNLNTKRVVYNIPLSMILGETEDPNYPTINYRYEDRVYHLNGYKVMVYDSLFAFLTEQGYYNTAIVLNDWNKAYPEIIHPKARRQTGASLYYAFNTEEEDGVRTMEAVASFLAHRYSSGEHGMVHDWVIANEVNQHTIWNYMSTDDLYYYTGSFEKSFRTFYNAIKSVYSNANVYFSLDQNWNNNYGNNRRFFNGRDFLYVFNEIAQRDGNYDWGLSIHPYADPLTKVRFWRGNFDKSETALVLTPMNLSTATNILIQDEFLDTKGNVRNIAVTELGFSSKPGEKLQAAAFAYCYYIIDNNDYITCFLLNRQTDDADSLKSGLALGLYNSDYSEKRIVEVFSNIDSELGDEYIDEMLEVIGAGSLEEALSWAE